eukprot:745105-Rhodomonas_salina.1
MCGGTAPIYGAALPFPDAPAPVYGDSAAAYTPKANTRNHILRAICTRNAVSCLCFRGGADAASVFGGADAAS